jgi:hypothetical protein
LIRSYRNGHDIGSGLSRRPSHSSDLKVNPYRGKAHDYAL